LPQADQSSVAENFKLLAIKLRAAAGQLRYLPPAAGLVWAAAHCWTVLWAGLLVVQGLLPAAAVYLTRALVDSLVAATGAGGDWSSVRPTLLLAALMAALLLVMELLRRVTDWVRAVQSELVQDHITTLIQNKSTTVDLAFYESPDFHDHLHRARIEAGYRPIELLESTGSLMQNGITLVAMAAVLMRYGPLIPVALLVSTLPAFYVVARYAAHQHRWRVATTMDERRTRYYDWLMTEAGTAAELRLFDLGGYFRSAYGNLRARLRREHLHLLKAQGLAELGAGAVALLITGACLGWMVWRALLHQVTLGDLALFYQAFSQGQQLMGSLLSGLGQIYYNVLFLGNLFEFLDLESRLLDPQHPRTVAVKQNEDRGVTICFRQVTFRYPGSERAALRGLDLSLEAGKIAAIVGPNGAGKSTLLKLICRFYDPEAGTIEVDGIDIRDLQLHDLRRLITVLFQEPVHYNAPVAENIALADLPAAGAGAIEAAARAAGADALIARLPQGFDTLLGKAFLGGAELSVGEWQRLALARAFLRRAPIIILDEPTSAMDSWAEAEWLQRMRSLVANRTAIIVTHRFTTAMQADIIHVMHDGQVVESGSHAELLRAGGRYAQSWRAQMRVDQDGS
jgi:ATP-binding cassette, subfamily B, bacterial